MFARVAGPLFVLAATAVCRAEPAATGATEVSLGQLWRQGGWSMYPLALLSIATFGLILYNTLNLRERSFLRPEIIDQLRLRLGARDLAGAREICQREPYVVSNILAAGLRRVENCGADAAAIEKAMEEAAAEEVAAPFGLISYLSIIATLAPMVGMLGTVSGMIKAFRNIAVGGMGKPELLADNISEALITTAVGLVVGIPAMFAFFYFKSRFGRLSARIARTCGELHHTLAQAAEPAPGPARLVEIPAPPAVQRAAT